MCTKLRVVARKIAGLVLAILRAMAIVVRRMTTVRDVVRLGRLKGTVTALVVRDGLPKAFKLTFEGLLT